MHLSKKYYESYSKCFDCVPNIEKLKNSSILITGGTGLIGSSVVDFLAVLNDKTYAGNRIYVGSRNEEKFRERFTDLENREDLIFFPYNAENIIKTDINFDYIIHAASPATPLWYSENPCEVMTVIFEGTKNILDYAKDHKVKKIVYISSSEIYGQKDGAKSYSEGDYSFIDILNPRSCYPSAKRAAETLCAAYSKEYEVDVSTVRPGHIYGPTMTKEDVRASSSFLRDVLFGKDIIMKSPGMQLRSYTYVADCSSATIAVMLNGKTSESYNISNKESVVTIRKFAEELARCAGRSIIFENPSDLEKSGYNLMDNSSLFSDKIEALGWDGIFNLHDGIEASLEALKNE